MDDDDDDDGMYYLYALLTLNSIDRSINPSIRCASYPVVVLLILFYF